MTVIALFEAVMMATRRGGRRPATNCAKSETTRSLLLNCGESAEPIYLIKNLKILMCKPLIDISMLNVSFCTRCTPALHTLTSSAHLNGRQSSLDLTKRAHGIDR